MIERLPSTDIRVEVRRPDRERPGREFALGHAFIRESELDVAIEALITARKQARERKRAVR